jgi:polyhydroxyalkanoate synthesis regulator phasin
MNQIGLETVIVLMDEALERIEKVKEMVENGEVNLEEDTRFAINQVEAIRDDAIYRLVSSY